MRKILAMDLSLNCPAFAVVEIREGRAYILEVFHVNNKRNTKWTQAEKLSAIGQALRDLLSRHHGIDAFVRERGFSRFAQTTQALFRVVGISDLITFEEVGCRQIEEIPPTTVKSLVGGHGKATKDEVEDGVRALLVDEQKDFVFVTDDESDSVAVALSYAIKKGWMN